MADKKTEDELWRLNQCLRAAASTILLLEDRVAALESERGIALAAYRKTHPAVVNKLNKALGIKPNKKKEDLAAALERVRDTDLADCWKTHPEAMKKLNEVLGNRVLSIKPKKKKPKR